MIRSARALSACAVMSLAACASGEPPPFRKVAGPESPELLVGIPGRVAIGEGQSHCYPLRTVDLASPPVCIPRPDDIGWDSAIAPSRDRAVLRMFTTPTTGSRSETRLPLTIALQSVADCPGGELHCAVHAETIASWSGAPGGDVYHQPLALSPDGRRVAVVPSSRLLKGPGYSPRLPSDARFHGLRYVGELMLVDLATHAVRHSGIDVVGNQPVSWSADGKRLRFVRAEPIEALSPTLAAGIVGPVGHAGQGVPVIEMWDADSGAITMLAIGLQPLWSPDDRTLLFQPAHDRLATLDLVDHVGREVVLPGMSTRYEAIAIAFVAPVKILYWALPTAGDDPDYTIRNSPLVGPKQLLSLKVADLDDGAFATVQRSVDPRARVGYRAD